MRKHIHKKHWALAKHIYMKSVSGQVLNPLGNKIFPKCIFFLTKMDDNTIKTETVELKFESAGC